MALTSPMYSYTVGKKVGSGAFGTVHRATRECVLKEIDISNIPEEEKSTTKEEWEKQTVELLRIRGHNNIVAYMNSFASDDFNKLWIEMEHCPGGTFNDFMLQKNPKNEIKHRLMTEISSGLAFLHEYGIFHYDLKPENIMIEMGKGDRPHAKVADFGLAKIIASCTFNGRLNRYYARLGARGRSEFFMAPEVYHGEYTEKADIFALGVIYRAILPRTKSRLIDGKPYIVDDILSMSLGKFMKEKGSGVKYKDSITSKLGDNIRKLLDSMIEMKFQQRPAASEVNLRLNSISPKELYLLESTSPQA